MTIKLKIVFVVLPLLIVTLLLAGTSSYVSAATGITRIAKEFLGFKSSELEKYAVSQWNLLVDNNLTEREDMVGATKAGIESFAKSIIKSDTEIIIAFDSKGNITMSTRELIPETSEKKVLSELISSRETQLVYPLLAGSEKVAKGFYFEPFGWYYLLTEEKETFYSDVNKITRQTVYILVIASLISVILMIVFANYLTKPLSKVADTMKDIISSNDLSERVKVEYNDETGRLAHTFNIMVGELERAYNQIKNYAFKAVLAQKKEAKIRNIFQKYVPQELIDKFFENPESMLVGDNRVLSILFSDIRSFTTISEGMPPDELVNSLNRYFSVMVDIIMERKGVIDKYIGDAIMAFFGAPVKHDDDAINSVLAGIEMSEAVKIFNAEQLKAGKPEFKIGVGINYGIVTVGNIGTEKKMDYTVIGDMVNLASRLEGLTKKYHQELLISESLHMKVKDKLPCRLLDTVAVKGKKKGVKIYTVKKELPPFEEKAWKIHNSGMDMYYNFDFKNAIDNFRQVKTILKEDFMADEMLVRCTEYLKNPPPKNWDGVEIMHEK